MKQERMGTEDLSMQQVFDREHTGRRAKEVRLKPCAHCGRIPEFKSREHGKHLFWRVVCPGCGIGTWCTEDGYGHMDETGRNLAAAEWNARI